MYPGSNRQYGKLISVVTLVAALLYAVFETWRNWDAVAPRGFLLLALTLAAGFAGGLGARKPGGRAVRVAPSFVLAALLFLPAPSGLWVALAAIAVSAGGFAGAMQPGLACRAASVVATIAAQVIATNASAFAEPASLPALLLVTVLYVNLQGFSLAAGWMLGGLPDRDLVEADVFPTRIFVAETLNAPLAWLLVAFLVPPLPPVVFGVCCVLILLGGVSLRSLAVTREDLESTNDSLAARASELATLHAIGREIVSSLDLRKVYAIIERECRKILDVDQFSIALVDPDTNRLRFAYRHVDGEPPIEDDTVIGDGIETWVVAEKRGVRLEDGSSVVKDVDRVPDSRGPGFESAMAVPLIIEDRVIGILEVQSRRPRAYDEHQLAVLTTVAQQAAVAIENARHHRMATVDSLTGLFLRDYFFRRVEEEYNRAKRYDGCFALLMIDLDGFKSINDRYGHLAADRYLQSLGSVIRTRLRAADLACRFGGDEFCLLLPETDIKGAKVIAERIRVALGRLTLDSEDGTIQSTVSIGVAVYPEHDAGELAGLLRRSDQALYRAKRGGKNRVTTYSKRFRTVEGAPDTDSPPTVH